MLGRHMSHTGIPHIKKEDSVNERNLVKEYPGMRYMGQHVNQEEAQLSESEHEFHAHPMNDRSMEQARAFGNSTESENGKLSKEPQHRQSSNEDHFDVKASCVLYAVIGLLCFLVLMLIIFVIVLFSTMVNILNKKMEKA